MLAWAFTTAPTPHEQAYLYSRVRSQISLPSLLVFSQFVASRTETQYKIQLYLVNDDHARIQKVFPEEV